MAVWCTTDLLRVVSRYFPPRSEKLYTFDRVGSTYKVLHPVYQFSKSKLMFRLITSMYLMGLLFPCTVTIVLHFAWFDRKFVYVLFDREFLCTEANVANVANVASRKLR